MVLEVFIQNPLPSDEALLGQKLQCYNKHS
ncbi:hypothetical protein HNR48_001398 [Pseudoteredinibacter isoporae]|uniref:Uncharacterized protein n=1 Tax=Pseudoteredinibacter isoporae TaxID=570281 RepID=A0A7X0JRU4_9GAMM|nr:hypothetical protein [Pseudoteredinibacter isoporae]